MLITRFHKFLLSAEATSAVLMRTATKTCWPHVLTSHIAVTCILFRRWASVQRKSIKLLATKNRAYQLRYFWPPICLHLTSRKPRKDLFSGLSIFTKICWALVIWLKSRQREQSPPPPNSPDRWWGPPCLLFRGYWLSFPGLKRLWLIVNLVPG